MHLPCSACVNLEAAHVLRPCTTPLTEAVRERTWVCMGGLSAHVVAYHTCMTSATSLTVLRALLCSMLKGGCTQGSHPPQPEAGDGPTSRRSRHKRKQHRAPRRRPAWDRGWGRQWPCKHGRHPCQLNVRQHRQPPRLGGSAERGWWERGPRNGGRQRCGHSNPGACSQLWGRPSCRAVTEREREQGSARTPTRRPAPTPTPTPSAPAACVGAHWPCHSTPPLRQAEASCAHQGAPTSGAVER